MSIKTLASLSTACTAAVAMSIRTGFVFVLLAVGPLLSGAAEITVSGLDITGPLVLTGKLTDARPVWQEPTSGHVLMV